MSLFVATTDADVNVAAFDKWSVAHLGVGFALGATKVSGWAFLTGAVVYELLEPALEARYPALFQNPNAESPRNKVADVAIGLVGFALGRALT